MKKFYYGLCILAYTVTSFARGNIASATTHKLPDKCLSNGGQIVTQYTSSNKPYKVCIFEDNRQCELQALAHGACPIGGIKITGYDNQAQMFCAIKGGKVFAESDAVCTLPNGKKCLATTLFKTGHC